MSVTLSPLAGAGWQFFDANGTPLAGGLLYTYIAGTTTPATTYTSVSGVTANTNPIILDAAGRVAEEIWLNTAYSYKFVLKTSTSVEVWTKDNISSTVSAADVFFTPGGTTTQRSVQSRLTDTVSFADFPGVDPTGITDSTAGMQTAIDYVASLGGGIVMGPQGAEYKITDALRIKTGVIIDLCGATVKQYTSNTPIFTAPSGQSTQGWALRNGVLRFNTQQNSSQTDAVGIRLANGAFSYDFNIDRVQVSNACDGIQCPSTTGSYAFVAEIRDFIGNDCARYSINIDCDSAVGANTNLVFVNCWALQTQGAEQPGSMGFRFNACSMCQWQSLYADHIQGQFLFVQTSSGWFGVLTAESIDIEVAPNQLTSIVQFSDVSADINVMKFVVSNFKTYNQIVANVTGTIPVGATITGATSGATGTVRTTGTGAGTTITYYMTNAVNFSAGENILVSAVSQGTVTTATDQTGNIYLFRTTSSTYNVSFQQTISQYVTSGNTYLGQNIYDVVPTSNVPATSGPTWVYNWWAQTDRTVQLADFSTPKSIRYWNGDNRYYTLGMTADAAWDGNQTNFLSAAMTAANSYSTYTPVANDRQLRFKSTAFGNDRDGGLTLYSTNGAGVEQYITKALRLRTNSGGVPRLSLVAPDNVNGTWEILTSNGSNVETQRLAGTAAGSLLAGAPAALATNATDGFLYVPTCAGTPTGTPTTQTGLAPIVINTTNNKLYFYSGGAWRDAGP